MTNEIYSNDQDSKQTPQEQHRIYQMKHRTVSRLTEIYQYFDGIGLIPETEDAKEAWRESAITEAFREKDAHSSQVVEQVGQLLSLALEGTRVDHILTQSELIGQNDLDELNSLDDASYAFYLRHMDIYESHCIKLREQGSLPEEIAQTLRAMPFFFPNYDEDGIAEKRDEKREQALTEDEKEEILRSTKQLAQQVHEKIKERPIEIGRLPLNEAQVWQVNQHDRNWVQFVNHEDKITNWQQQETRHTDSWVGLHVEENEEGFVKTFSVGNTMLWGADHVESRNLLKISTTSDSIEEGEEDPNYRDDKFIRLQESSKILEDLLTALN